MTLVCCVYRYCLLPVPESYRLGGPIRWASTEEV